MTSADEQENTTYLWVAETVLARQGHPLTVADIVQIGLDDGLFGDKALSKTPQKSMQARLSMDIVKHGTGSRFLRTAPGRFFLRNLVDDDIQRSNEIETAGDRLVEYIPPRRAPLPPTEQVLVVGRKDYESILDFQGIDFSYEHIVKLLLSSPSLRYMPRAQAETNNDFKQFITYTMIQSGYRLLSFRRGSYNRAPSFIRGARCIGFGGHVNEEDFDLLSYSDRGIRANAAREIREELRVDLGEPDVKAEDVEPIGVLNDDSSEVGRRHLALVLRYTPPHSAQWARPTRGEASINDLKWIPLKRKAVNLPDFEYWSQLCLRKLFPSDVSGISAYLVRKRSAFNHPHTLCIAGAIGSGKSITTSTIRDRCGYSVINTGAVLASILGIPPVPSTPRDRFQSMAKRFIEKKKGPETLARTIADLLKSMGPNRTIIDGIRHKATLDQLKNYAPLPLAVVYVQTPPDVAFDLYRIREQSDVSLGDFMKLFNGPSESSVRYLINEADAVLYNWQGLDGYKKVINQFIDEAKLMRGSG